MTEIKFNLEQAVKDIQSGKPLSGKNGLLTPLIKQITEAALQAEIDAYLSEKVDNNRRNGYTSKTVKTNIGSFSLDTPRDRNGDFEPELVRKNQRVLTEELDEKILSMFTLGMGYRDIQSHVEELYGLDVSTGTISAVTDKLLEELHAWRTRPLSSHYPIVWLDAIHYKVKQDKSYQSKAFYTLVGLNTQGHKEILGLYLSKNEGAKHWLSVLTDIQNRGVEDILIACVDGLTGFPEAIEAVYPKTEVQLCIVHQIRNSLKYIASKDQKDFMKDLRQVYKASSLENAESALDDLEVIWGDKYPLVIQSWRKKWVNLSAYFKYPKEIRKVVYTTNTVEAIHRQFRKLTKTKGAFPNDNSLLKLLYAGILRMSKKWTMPIPNWGQAVSAFAIHFKGRLDNVIDL